MRIYVRQSGESALIAWQSDFVGRGYLRFAELTIRLRPAGEDVDATVLRAGPSRVEIRLAGSGERPPTEVLEGLARRLHGLLVVYCQAPVLDLHRSSDLTVDEDGKRHQSARIQVLDIPSSEAAVVIPFDHMTDMSVAEVQDLARILRTAESIQPRLLDSIQHSLTRAEGDVEAFLANYAVLDAVLGKGKSGVDAFILQREPDVEMMADSRRKSVTIYTLLRNAKGHPTRMAPGEASVRIRQLLPSLRGHVRTALLEQASA